MAPPYCMLGSSCAAAIAAVVVFALLLTCGIAEAAADTGVDDVARVGALVDEPLNNPCQSTDCCKVLRSISISFCCLSCSKARILFCECSFTSAADSCCSLPACCEAAALVVSDIILNVLCLRSLVAPGFEKDSDWLLRLSCCYCIVYLESTFLVPIIPQCQRARMCLGCAVSKSTTIPRHSINGSRSFVVTTFLPLSPVHLSPTSTLLPEPSAFTTFTIPTSGHSL